MPTSISNTTLQGLIKRGAQIVEVLPREEYEMEHLSGAINIPLKELNARTADQLRKDLPLIVYCNDFL
jgi:rhodanese-related sulfurtransferase